MSSRGSSAWLLQRVTGVLILLILGTHVLLYHYILGPVNWGYDIIGFGAADLAKIKADPNLMKYYSLAKVFANPLWKVFDVTLISLGIYHGFYGIKAIIDDWVTRDSWRFIANWMVYLLGIVLWVWGIMAVITFNPKLV